MKILFLLPYAPSLIRVRPHQFLRELNRRHDVTVLAIESDPDLIAGKGLESLPCSIEVVPFKMSRGLTQCAKGALRGIPLQASICQLPELTRALQRLLTSENWDMVHIEHLRAAHLANMIPAHIPTVYDSVDSISLLLERTLRSSHSLKQRLVAAMELSRTKRYEGTLMRHFSQVVVTSADDANALQSLAPGTNATVIPNGVDLDYFQPMASTQDSQTLVISGKMSYHANATAALHFVREIYPLVKQTHPNVRLRIVGSDPPKSIKALAKDSSIEVTGYRPDIRRGFVDAAMTISPLVVKVGIQNKTLESMAMGIPVVSSRAGYEGLSAKPGEDLLVANSTAQFAQEVCRLLDDPGLRERIGRAGRQYVETNHRWDVMTHSLEQVYAEAIELQQSQTIKKVMK